METQGQAYVTEIAGANYMVDEAAERIQFLDSRFYKAGEGFVPSVTTILEAYPKGANYYEWLKRNGENADEIRDEAGRRGSVVHKATELLDQGIDLRLMDDHGNPQYKLKEWAMIDRYHDFRNRFPATVHAVELNMVSSKLGYGGTLDRVFTIHHDGITYLTDIKTSADIYDSYWMQQAAYLNLLQYTGHIATLFPDTEIPEIRLAILWLNAKTRAYKEGVMQGPGWQFLTQKQETGDILDMFNCVHAVWLKANEGVMPKTTSYSLKLTLNNTSK